VYNLGNSVNSHFYEPAIISDQATLSLSYVAEPEQRTGVNSNTFPA
jgi:hypothetical protein